MNYFGLNFLSLTAFFQYHFQTEKGGESDSNFASAFFVHVKVDDWTVESDYFKSAADIVRSFHPALYFNMPVRYGGKGVRVI